MATVFCPECERSFEHDDKRTHCVCGTKITKGDVLKANERQVGGQHYKTTTGKEHWDIVAEFGLDYFQGNITKYVMRWRDKGKVEDLKKARHYLDKYIELIEAGGIK